jgi:hypothetical protein
VTTCVSYLQGIAIRATKLDTCGAPVAGTCSTVVSKGFMSMDIEADEESGNAISPTLADGSRCYYQQSPKLLNGIKVNIEFCQVDPELINLLTGSPLVVDDSTPTPASIGFTTDSAAYGLANVALELWMNLAGGNCASATGRKWGYYLLPWLYQGTVGKPTVENDAVNFTVNEAITHDGNQWGVGPYNIQNTRLGVASPLFTALSTTAHDLLMPVNLAPPTPVCGCQTLVIPT